jgi:hypothetical protein
LRCSVCWFGDWDAFDTDRYGVGVVVALCVKVQKPTTMLHIGRRRGPITGSVVPEAVHDAARSRRTWRGAICCKGHSGLGNPSILEAKIRLLAVSVVCPDAWASVPHAAPHHRARHQRITLNSAARLRHDLWEVKHRRKNQKKLGSPLQWMGFTPGAVHGTVRLLRHNNVPPQVTSWMLGGKPNSAVVP